MHISSIPCLDSRANFGKDRVIMQPPQSTEGPLSKHASATLPHSRWMEVHMHRTCMGIPAVSADALLLQSVVSHCGTHICDVLQKVVSRH